MVPNDALADLVAHVGDFEYDRDVCYDAVVAFAVGDDKFIVYSSEGVGYTLFYRFFLDVTMAKFVGVGDDVAAY